MEGFVRLYPDDLKSPLGLSMLNQMLSKLFDSMPGDGETISVYKGFGSPENVIRAGVGSLYQRLDGGANTTLYVKESGTGATGWVAK